MSAVRVLEVIDQRPLILFGGRRQWRDYTESRFVEAATVYIPFGCPDWGEKGGRRNSLCSFCALPNAVAGYREAFYDGKPIPVQHHIDVFRLALENAMRQSNCHTLMIFNAGSFLAMPEVVQEGVVLEIVRHPSVRRVVIESRAELVTEHAVKRLTGVLTSADKALTVRIGVETQDDHLRLSVLRKGHTRQQLHRAVEVLQNSGVVSGGYVLLNPAPGLDPFWAMQEAEATIDWVLGSGQESLGMEECYFCSTNVGPGTPLTACWEHGAFQPASLWMVLAVLRRAVQRYGPRVHLLPFRDEPELLAVPSNHIQGGLPQSLEGAAGCDVLFHEMLDRYRETMDRSVLVPPVCSCRPSWFSDDLLSEAA